MPAHSIKAVQKIPISVKEAWEFFASPANLPAITPPQLSFNIISKHHGETMYPGQIIEYTVSPIAGIKLYWMTEITHVRAMDFFIDEQRYGPYSMWHHEHHFKEIAGGVEMTDLVHYKNPFGFIGNMVNPLLVKPKLKEIFSFRFRKVSELFGPFDGQVENVELF